MLRCVITLLLSITNVAAEGILITYNDFLVILMDYLN